MDTIEATNLAQELMLAYGLKDWTFRLNKNKRRLGVCKEYMKRIEMSEYYVARNSREMVVDTILHEVAHALVGASHGHDEVWKKMCELIGCNPRSCDKEVNMPEGDWRAQCQHCRKVFNRHKRPKFIRGYYCTACGPEHGSLIYTNIKVIYQKRMDKALQTESVQLMLKIF